MFKFISFLFEECSPEDHVRRSFYAGVVCWIISFIALFWIPEMWVDLIILTLCLYGVYKYNKWASLALFVFYTLGRIVITVQTGRFTGLFSLLFIYLFLRGMIGSFLIGSLASKVSGIQLPIDGNATACPRCNAAISVNQKRCYSCGVSLAR